MTMTTYVVQSASRCILRQRPLRLILKNLTSTSTQATKHAGRQSSICPVTSFCVSTFSSCDVYPILYGTHNTNTYVYYPQNKALYHLRDVWGSSSWRVHVQRSFTSRANNVKASEIFDPKRADAKKKGKPDKDNAKTFTFKSSITDHDLSIKRNKIISLLTKGKRVIIFLKTDSSKGSSPSEKIVLDFHKKLLEDTKHICTFRQDFSNNTTTRFTLTPTGGPSIEESSTVSESRETDTY